MSSDVQAAANKKAALERLRFNKSKQTARQASALSAAAQRTAANQPPAQSRDATVSSKFFPATPSSPGNVLVPNSSPIAQDEPQRPYEPYGYRRPHDVASLQNNTQGRVWSPNLAFMAGDSLSAPSGIRPSSSSLNASTRRQWSHTDSPHDSTQEEGPPRKRLNRGRPEGSTSMSPPPPVISHQPSPRPRTVSDAFSISSEDSLPDVTRLTSSSNTRIHRKSASSTDTTADPFSDPEFIKLKMTMPTESPARVRAAWLQAAGNTVRATALMSDPAWSPISSVPEKVERDDVGRVKEVEEATRAQKMAVKEKGKKSMIYANRITLETKVQSTPKNEAVASVDMSLTPMTPIIAPRQRKRLKNRIESESEAEDSEEDEREKKRERVENTDEAKALRYLNSTTCEGIQELTGCNVDQANTIIKLRPFKSVEDLNLKLGQGRKKAGPAGISPRLFEDCTEIFKGYGAVDSILEECESIGARKGKERADPLSTFSGDDVQDGSLSLRTIINVKSQKSEEHLTRQPSLLSTTVKLKDYQLLGVNWLNLLYREKLSCILADEMEGLGKTVQVISFLAHLKGKGNKGPHLVVVPSSTLENWCREFARFAPSISVQTYYAGKGERSQLREMLLGTQMSNNGRGEGWEVLITTYTLAQGDERDRKFFRKIDWNCCIYDEGHVLKNFQSQRYQSLLKFGSRWRLLLTGTPLQNNLQELVSLMNFILPDQFANTIGEMRAIFKVKGDSKISLLSQERVSRAKKMMTPFVLRRRKDQVLQDLPQKTERIEWCEMTDLQKSIYNEALQRSRRTILEMEEKEVSTDSSAGTGKKATKANGKAKVKEKIYAENSSNVLMDLRKAASHPMLFRKRFTDDTLSGITNQLLKEPDFKKRGALYELVKEDMSVMTDAELQLFCKTYKSTRKYLQHDDCYLEAGKVEKLLHLLEKYKSEERKVLIFSQFTQILDILQAIFDYKKIRFSVLTGSTPVDVRQTLVDEFTEDEDIPIFLLSTRAGGMGINLTAASVVIMFDQDFNPHNDKQAQDRAYRIGQKRDVEVIKLISRGTIEEDILKLGQTKLALDEAVAADPDEKGESAPEREMKKSLMTVLRQQFEKQQDEKASAQ
ncbi:hypothetical protein NP233_g1325 [Leucocoprinus birnbaumii]|uniref:DNA helicase n=1 Tax=Leucocoprinus birnbaumii TaxID=56174 RepID=A0AAD5W4A5_9AGAR|nr:hypothetical protein NP233_g1325 [Leucocoprinus birnbaumii]